MSTVEVAKRELFDVVVAACRVRGLDPGTAHRVARNVVTAQEVERDVVTAQQIERDVATIQALSADAAVAVLTALDPTSGRPFATSPFVWAPDVIIDAELTARSRGETTATVDFGEAVPWAAVAATVAEAASRNVIIETPDVARDAPPSPSKSHQSGAPSAFTIDAGTFSALKRIAAGFLVPEVDVDAALD